MLASLRVYFRAHDFPLKRQNTLICVNNQLLTPSLSNRPIDHSFFSSPQDRRELQCPVRLGADCDQLGIPAKVVSFMV